MSDFPFTDLTRLEHRDDLPRACDTVIIGGGIIGVMTAYYLACQGQRVVVCEKGRIAGEQSSRNWGWVRQQGRHPAELSIMVEAHRLWRELTDLMSEDIGYRTTGILYMAADDEEMATFERWLPHAREAGVDSRLLSRDEVMTMLPGARGDWAGGLHTPSDGRAEPWFAVPALARLAKQAGATLRESCAVRALDLQSGVVTGVFTEHGRVGCQQVVLAAGAWSSLFLRNHGVRLPQLSVLGSVMATEALELPFTGGAADPDLAFRTRLDGGATVAHGFHHDFFIGPDAFRYLRPFGGQVRGGLKSTHLRLKAPAGYPDAWGTPRRWRPTDVSPFERMRVLNPEPNRRTLDTALERFADTWPLRERPGIRKAWAGMIDTLPDELPVIDRVPAINGLILATGMSGHGFGIGPGFGRVLADRVLGRPVGHDLSAFRYERFFDGTRLEPGLAF